MNNTIEKQINETTSTSSRRLADRVLDRIDTEIREAVRRVEGGYADQAKVGLAVTVGYNKDGELDDVLALNTSGARKIKFAPKEDPQLGLEL